MEGEGGTGGLRQLVAGSVEGGVVILEDIAGALIVKGAPDMLFNGTAVGRRGNLGL